MKIKNILILLMGYYRVITGASFSCYHLPAST